MSLFGALFRSKEVRDVSFAFRCIGEEPIGENLCFGEIARQAQSLIRSNPDAVKRQVIVENLPPMQVALSLIMNLCGRDLGSGEFHIYRGKLSMRGMARKALFNEAQKMMVERGFINQDDADFGVSQLHEEIAQAG